MNSSSVPKAAASSVLPVAEVGSPTLLVLQVTRSWEDENKQKVWPPEEKSRNLGHSLFLPHPMPGMAMEDHEETSTLKLRSRVAGELATEPRPPHPGWGRSPVMAQAPGTGGQ